MASSNGQPEINEGDQGNLALIASCFQEDRNWGENFYEYIETLNEREPMEPGHYHYSLATAVFCGAEDLIPGFDTKVNWFGFGELPVAFEDQNDEKPLMTMFWVNDFAKVSGIDPARLIEFWQEGRDEEDRSDLFGLTYYDPARDDHFTQPLLGHSAAMRAMAFLSPWHKEFYEATKEMMAHALVKSGLADTFANASESGFTAVAHMEKTDGEVIKLQMMIHSFREEDNVPIVRAPWDDAGEDELIPITDLCQTYEVLRASDAVHDFLGPRVSEEEAKSMAFRGPIAALAPDA